MDVDTNGEIIPRDIVGTKEHTTVVRIRLYRQPRDWSAVREMDFCCGPNGEVDLEKVRKEFGIEEACRVRSYIRHINSA